MAPHFRLCGVDRNQDKGRVTRAPASKVNAEQALRKSESGDLVALFHFFLIGKAEGRGAARHWRRRLEILVAHRASITVTIAVWLRLLLLLLTELPLLLKLAALRHQDPIIVLGMLEIVLLHDPIAGRSRVARKLQVFLIHMGRRAANLDVRSRRIESPIVIMVVIMIVLRPTAASA